MAARAEQLALRIPPRTVAIVMGVTIAIFAVLGALDHAYGGLGLFDLDGEGKPPAAFSALLDLTAGVLAFLVYRRGAGWSFLGLALVFTYMALDDAVTIHEHLEILIGLDWEIIYIPIVLGAGVAWGVSVAGLRRIARGAAALLVAGACAWVLAQAFEIVETDNGRRVEGYRAMATAEEVLEMIGSACFVGAMQLGLRELAGPRPQRP